MQKVTPCLWYDGTAEEAANFYVTLLPDSRVESVVRSPAKNPSTEKGEVLVVEFTSRGSATPASTEARNSPSPKPCPS